MILIRFFFGNLTSLHFPHGRCSKKKPCTAKHAHGLKDILKGKPAVLFSVGWSYTGSRIYKPFLIASEMFLHYVSSKLAAEWLNLIVVLMMFSLNPQVLHFRKRPTCQKSRFRVTGCYHIFKRFQRCHPKMLEKEALKASMAV